jgi:hypothetical protein
MALGMGPKHFVFIDEVAADSRSTNMQHVWTLKGTKMCTEALFVRGQRITTIAAMSADGLVGKPLLLRGSATADDFVGWFKEQVVPDLGSFPAKDHCSVVIMDNCHRIHDKHIQVAGNL